MHQPQVWWWWWNDIPACIMAFPTVLKKSKITSPFSTTISIQYALGVSSESCLSGIRNGTSLMKVEAILDEIGLDIDFPENRGKLLFRIRLGWNLIA